MPAVAAAAAGLEAPSAEVREERGRGLNPPPPLPFPPCSGVGVFVELCDVRPLYLRVDYLVTLASFSSLYAFATPPPPRGSCCTASP